MCYKLISRTTGVHIKKEEIEKEENIKDITLKDMLYIGLGSALIAKEKIEKEFSGCIEKGKKANEKAEEFSDEAEKKSEKLIEESEKIIKEKIKEIAAEMGFATKEDIEELKKLIKAKK